MALSQSVEPENPVRFIDLHVHCGRAGVFSRSAIQGYITPEHLIERYNELGVELGVLQPMVNPEFGPSPQSNEEMFDICREYPDRFVTFCNVDPRTMRNSPSAPFDRLLEQYRVAGCKGVGEICANLAFDDPRMSNLFACCERQNLPVLFHMAPALEGYYGIFDGPGLPGLERALNRFRDLVFLGHSQAFWAEMGILQDVSPAARNRYPSGPIDKPGRVVELMRQYPNLHGDLCGTSAYNALTRDPDFGVAFIQEFQDRLYFGTDIVNESTTPRMNGLLENLRSTGRISESIFRKIARENALTLLNRPSVTASAYSATQR